MGESKFIPYNQIGKYKEPAFKPSKQRPSGTPLGRTCSYQQYCQCNRTRFAEASKFTPIEELDRD